MGSYKHVLEVPTRARGQASPYDETVSDAEITRSHRIISLFFIMLVVAVVWSYFASVTEVSSGPGKVIPNSREQVVQSLEGGILAELRVREGDIVEAGQMLAQLDLTKTEANVGESAARYRAALASVARLTAEVNGRELVFPEELHAFPELLASEERLYNTRRESLAESLKGLRESLALLTQELNLTKSLASAGAASRVEVLKLQRQMVDLRLKAADREAEYMVAAREELAKAQADAASLEAVIRGRSDSLSRLTLRSPVRGVVKDIEVTTRGGVVPPNGRLMTIVPVDDQLMIEARISPRDIAFIHPGQRALVKITAYEYSIYGGLEGEVVLISPDTIQDEVQPDVFYYRVFIRTYSDALLDKEGRRLEIVPGMVASVDIQTGEKTVLDYLLKPINRAKEALRER